MRKYVYIDLADDWACLWRVEPSGKSKMIWEHHDLPVSELVAYIRDDGCPGAFFLEYEDRISADLLGHRGRLDQGVTLEAILGAGPPPDCSAHGCVARSVVRYEILNAEGVDDELRFPTYCTSHAKAAETNPTMRKVEDL